MSSMIKKGLGSPLGSGNQYMPWVHIDDAVNAFMSAIEGKIKANLDIDLMHYKYQIAPLIENEIVSRFYFQKGRIEASLNKDPYIFECNNIFKNDSLYNSILGL